MTQSKYRLVFSGELIEGFKHHEVKQSLAQLLKIPLDQAGHLIQGHRFRINKPLEQGKAERLVQKITARGAQCAMEPVGLDEDEEAPVVPKADSQPRADVQDEVVSEENEALSLDLPAFGGDEHLSLDLPQADDDGSLSLEQPELSNGSDSPRSMDAMEVGQDTEEDIVLSTSPVERADYQANDDSENLGTFYERTTRVESDPSAGNKPGWRMLAVSSVGALLVLAAGVWWWNPGLLAPPAASQPEVSADPVKPVNPRLAQTNARLDALDRSIRVWMIQYGSGFKPEQVTLERLQRDLQMGDQAMVDGWGTMLRYEPEEKVYQVVSAGPDRQFGTADDLRRKAQAK